MSAASQEADLSEMRVMSLHALALERGVVYKGGESDGHAEASTLLLAMFYLSILQDKNQGS